MDEAAPGALPPPNSAEDRLDSWKEIAAYLNRDVTTVQRWEKREGMPVCRHLHDRWLCLRVSCISSKLTCGLTPSTLTRAFKIFCDV